MDMWIQLHDLSSTETDGVTEEQAKQAFTTFDWQSELLKEKESNDETCPPGFGLVSDTDEILHICPGGDDSCFIYYHYPVSKKVLGLISLKTQKTHHIESCSIAMATELISHHFNGNQDAILKTK